MLNLISLITICSMNLDKSKALQKMTQDERLIARIRRRLATRQFGMESFNIEEELISGEQILPQLEEQAHYNVKAKELLEQISSNVKQWLTKIDNCLNYFFKSEYLTKEINAKNSNYYPAVNYKHKKKILSSVVVKFSQINVY